MRGATSFPVSESLLCYFVAALVRQGLTPSTNRRYLASVRYAQIVRELNSRASGALKPSKALVSTSWSTDSLGEAGSHEGAAASTSDTHPSLAGVCHLVPSGCRSRYCHAVGRSHCMFLWSFSGQA